jgi:hippurate hydrolase
VEYHDEYPATVNDATELDFAADTVRDLFGEQRFQAMDHPIAGAEDFSRVLREVPGAYVFLGACLNGEPESAPNNHSPLAAFDDRVLGDAAALLAELATRRLSRAS